jgi:predicted metal-binding membrane protein
MSTVARPARAVSGARTQVVLVGVLVALAAVAWVVTVDRMDGMSGPGAELGTLGFYVGVWVVMMAAMMFPSIAPMVVVYDRLRTAHHLAADATALFVAGYLVTWTAAGLVFYAVIEGARSLDVELGTTAAGLVVLAGGVYQLTPLKDACLTRCRGPLSFVLEHWRTGRAGALRMGIIHGAWCVGCCWALMATLFAVGVMSVGWMALVAALIAVEKLLPSKRAANLLVAGVLVVLGATLLVAPDVLPGMDTGMEMMASR